MPTRLLPTFAAAHRTACQACPTCIKLLGVAGRLCLYHQQWKLQRAAWRACRPCRCCCCRNSSKAPAAEPACVCSRCWPITHNRRRADAPCCTGCASAAQHQQQRQLCKCQRWRRFYCWLLAAHSCCWWWWWQQQWPWPEQQPSRNSTARVSTGLSTSDRVVTVCGRRGVPQWPQRARPCLNLSPACRRIRRGRRRRAHRCTATA